MEIKVQDEKHTALVAGLRELADWFEQHPELPTFKYPTLSYQPIGTSDEDGIAAVEMYAAALGTTVDRRYHVRTERTFGCLEFSAVMVLASSVTEHDARQQLYNAAHWVYTCEAEGVQSHGYETERAAQLLLEAHREGCNGGSHQVKLVPAEVQA
jgi:hypothetical protein